MRVDNFLDSDPSCFVSARRDEGNTGAGGVAVRGPGDVREGLVKSGVGVDVGCDTTLGKVGLGTLVGKCGHLGESSGMICGGSRQDGDPFGWWLT